MKLIVFLLVLGNLLFYAFSQGLIGPAEVGESVRITQQIKPESIRIVARGEAPALPQPAPAPTPEAETPPPLEVPAEIPALTGKEAAKAAKEAAAKEAAAKKEAKAREAAAKEAAAKEAAAKEAAAKEAAKAQAPTVVCMSWEGLSQVEGDRVRRVLAGGFDEFTWRESSVDSRGWWVSIPPQANRAAAEKKAAELKAIGITDYFIIQEGGQRHAISLGIFSSEKGASDHLATLQDKGVRSARVSQRPDKDGKESKPRLEIRGPAARADALRAALAQALPKNAPKRCP